ncbi:S41 family peptidase [Streptomyces sp. NPDC127040]|uniref:S41 family peptidase n=1 Tax=Streptomyces sp. NPDC127040 TaxID=3347116 RepID=UPI00364BE172
MLTSSTTFSGGEDVAYTLQAHGRAVVIGETTRGGAHPTVRHAITAHVQVTVPVARAVNTVTGTNWEGVGVLPDVPVPADRALDTALAAALHTGPGAERDTGPGAGLDTALNTPLNTGLDTALAAERR